MRNLAPLCLLCIATPVHAQMVFPEEATLLGPVETVFNYSTDHCAIDDIPDVEARAFRDANGNIQLFACHYDAFRMVGPDFNNLSRDCNNAAYTSALNPNRAMHDDHSWIHSVYSPDGTTVYAYMHNEHHGHLYGCSGTYSTCWYNSITFAESTDGGQSFSHAEAPEHVSMTAPFAFDEGAGPGGYFKPSNIIQHPSDGYFYMMIQMEEIGNQQRGVGLLRTLTPGDPTSWRGWDGNDFTIANFDPYNDTTANPDAHVLTPVGDETLVGMHSSVTWNTYFQKFVTVGASQRNNVWGFYYSISDDLINWSGRQLLMESNVWINNAAPTNVDRTLYASLIDHNSTDRNFGITGRDCYLYYTVWHSGSTYNRDLVRIPIRLNKLEVDGGWTVNSTATSYDVVPGDGKCLAANGQCTLMAALEEANARPASYRDSLLTISFNVPFGSEFNLSGPASHVFYKTVIDGWTNTGSYPNTLSFSEGDNAQHAVKINFNGYEAFELNYPHSGIRGIQIKEAGVTILADSCFVEGCYIMTDGESAHTFASNAIYIEGATGTRIGGPDPEQHCVLLHGIRAQSCDQLMVSHSRFGCTSDGITMLENEGGVALTLMDCTNASISNCQMSGGYNRAIDLSSSTENLISGCLIGLNAAGNTNMGLYNAGVYLDGNSNNNSIDACIFGAMECGVAHILMEDGASNNTITSSIFGASADLLPFANPDQTALAGILIGENCSGNSIGNGTFTGGNNFLHLPNAGVVLQSNAGSGNLISKNSFADNGGLAIDLGFDNWTSENDSNDEDDGPNNGMNYPEPVSIIIAEDIVELTYSFHGSPLTDITIQLYGSSQCDESGYGEGERYLDEQFITTNQNGDATVSFSVPNDYPFFSALALDSWSGDTGEFGPCSGEMSPQPVLSYSISETSLTVQTGQSTNAWLSFENLGFGYLEWSLYTNEAWLMADIENGTVAPGDNHGQYITLQAESLPVGTYHGAIYVATNDPEFAEFVIDVTLEVTPVLGGSFIAASTEIGITLSTNGSSTVSIQFTNPGEASTSWVASMPPGNSWVMPPSPNNGTLSAGQTGTLNLHFNSNGLTPGTYTSELVFNTNATDNSFVLIPITLTVTQGTGNAAIVVTPENIGITLNNAESASQEVMIQNIGNASLNWNIVLPANTPWLTLQGANSGSVPGMGMATTLLGINAVGLSHGSYNATVMINSNAVNSGPVLLSVALEVTQAQAGNALIAVNPPSTSYELYSGESILHALTISNTGNNNLLWSITAAPDVNWITLPESTSGLLGQNQMSTYNILIDASSMSPGTHSAQLIIESNASNYPTLVIPVELEVLDPIATIQAAPTDILCPGASFSIDYEILGVLDADNVCTVELSNSEGEFSDPQIIGSFNAISGYGSYLVTLPDGISEGSNYRLRLSSSQPATTYEPSAFSLSIAGSVNVSITPTDVLCVNESVELLATPSGGWWSGSSVQGNTFVSSEAGTHTLTYQVSSQGCAFSSETTITVAALPEVYMDAPSQLCDNDDPWNLNITPAGGMLEGTGVENGYFNPADLGAQSADLLYLFIDSNGCSASISATIEVIETPTFSLEVPDFFCTNDLAVDPEFSNVNGGQYTIDGTLTSVLDPSILAVGEHEMNYYVTVNGCTGVNSAMFEIIEAPEAPVVTFDGEWLHVSNATNNITWFLDNAAVGTGASFLPLESGFYTASASNGMCEATSESLFIEITSVESLASNAVFIYPNPFNGYLNIIVGDLPVDEVQLFDMSGRLVAHWNHPSIVSGTLRLGDQLASLAAGQYSLLISNANGLVRKVVQK